MVIDDLRRPYIASKTKKKGFSFGSLMAFSFLLFLFLSVFNRAKFGASFSYVALPSLLLVLLSLANKSIYKLGAFSLFLLYFVYFVSTCLSPYVSLGSDMLTFLFFCFVYVAIASYDYDASEIRLFINLYIVFAVICSLNIIYQWLTRHYYQPWFQRSSFYFLGVFRDPNYVMAYITPAAFFSFAKLFAPSKKRFRNKLLILLSVAVFGVAALATASRGALVSILASCLFFFVFSNKISVKRKCLFLFFLLVVASVLILIAINVLPQWALARFTSDATGAGRITLWGSALQCFYDNPIIGGGMNAGTFYSNSLAGNATHNVFIDIICDSGVIGFTLFLFFCATNLMVSKKSNLHFQLSCFIAFFLPLFFVNGFNTASFYLPLFFLGILSNYNLRFEYNDLL